MKKPGVTALLIEIRELLYQLISELRRFNDGLPQVHRALIKQEILQEETRKHEIMKKSLTAKIKKVYG